MPQNFHPVEKRNDVKMLSMLSNLFCTCTRWSEIISYAIFRFAHNTPPTPSQEGMFIIILLFILI